MTGRTGDKRKKQVEVTAAVKEQLTEYETALESQFGRQTDTSDLVGALLWGVPLWQAESMLRERRFQDLSRKDPGD